jgi:hypothetical protein
MPPGRVQAIPKWEGAAEGTPAPVRALRIAMAVLVAMVLAQLLLVWLATRSSGRLGVVGSRPSSPSCWP